MAVADHRVYLTPIYASGNYGNTSYFTWLFAGVLNAVYLSVLAFGAAAGVVLAIKVLA